MSRISHRRIAGAAVAALSLALAAATLSGCGSSGDGNGDDENADTEATSEKNDALSQTPWETTGSGSANGAVTHKTYGSGGNVLVVFGGYTAKSTYVQRWADELVRAKLAAEGFSEIYAVPGPVTAGYTGHELKSSDQAIVSALTGGLAAKARSITVVAHSSGIYVANEFLGLFGSSGKAALAEVTFFVLDGDAVPTATMQAMTNTFFVYAHDATINLSSHNAAGMQSLGAQNAKYGGVVEVSANGSGCNPKAANAGGQWCMHDTLITNLPHNHNFYDLADDYTDFVAPRAVVTSYLDKLGACGSSTKLVCPPIADIVHPLDGGT